MDRTVAALNIHVSISACSFVDRDNITCVVFWGGENSKSVGQSPLLASDTTCRFTCPSHESASLIG